MTTQTSTSKVNVPPHIREQALAIAEQAHAIARGDVADSLASAARRVQFNAETLLAWCNGYGST